MGSSRLNDFRSSRMINRERRVERTSTIPDVKTKNAGRDIDRMSTSKEHRFLSDYRAPLSSAPKKLIT